MSAHLGEFSGDERLIRIWAESGIPMDLSTLEYAARLLQRQRRALIEAFEIVEELCAGRVPHERIEQLRMEVRA